jgi:amino acid permease
MVSTGYKLIDCRIFNVFLTAFFAYGGTELVGITAGEAKDPSKTVPKAIKGTFYRILIFYTVALLVLGLIVPYNMYLMVT